MTTPPMYPPPPRSWWSRNWKWCVPCGCFSALVAMLGLVAAIVYFAFGMMKSSEAYRMAFEKAQANPAVIEALGQPIKDGFYVSGSVQVTGASGTADISFPISGPKGKGTVYAKATKSMDEWTFDELAVKIESTNEKIDLLEEKTE
jgi:hypothetical protein